LSVTIAVLVMVAWSFGPAEAQTVKISVDATAPGQPIERIWPFYGYDEVNYSTTAEGEALLKSIVQAHTEPVHIRTHFLLNTGNGTPSLKWGSTNVYTQDAAGNPVYSWTLNFETLYKPLVDEWLHYDNSCTEPVLLERGIGS
jgi:xylan 1,4-beta-xylosidase